MRAARLHAVGDLRVGEEPEPAAGAGMSLVRVTIDPAIACGTCRAAGTATRICRRSAWPRTGWWTSALVSRREGLGEVKEAFGDAAHRTGLKVIIEPQR